MKHSRTWFRFFLVVPQAQSLFFHKATPDLHDGWDTFYRRICTTNRKRSARTPRLTDRVLTPDLALSYRDLFGFGGAHVQSIQTHYVSVRVGGGYERYGVWSRYGFAR